MPSSLPTIMPARVPGDIDDVRSLFREYISSIGVDLSFQDIDAELAGLPGKYATPAGIILIARDHGAHPVGCCALRPLAESGVCEMKRLHVRPQARGQDIGRRLATDIVCHARGLNYRRMLLDTLASMHAARKIYASLGFQPTDPYYDNPLPDTLYMSLDL